MAHVSGARRVAEVSASWMGGNQGGTGHVQGAQNYPLRALGGTMRAGVQLAGVVLGRGQRFWG